MKKVFLDSSVLVAACASKTGASAYLLGCCRLGKICGYVSLDVIGEARKNVYLKLGKKSQKRLVFYLKQANLIFVREAAVEKVAQCEKYISQKDAPILAAALESPASFLVTLDRRHFFQAEVIKFVKPLVIISPKDFVARYLKKKK